jgi:hypothetical protein
MLWQMNLTVLYISGDDTFEKKFFFATYQVSDLNLKFKSVKSIFVFYKVKCKKWDSLGDIPQNGTLINKKSIYFRLLIHFQVLW